MSKFSSMKLRTKIAVGATVGAAVIAGGGAALAYFTDSGSGSGTASVGTSTAFTISGTDSGTNYPGQTTTVDLSVHNPGGGNQQIGTIYLSAVKACDSTSTWHTASAADNNVAGCYTGAAGPLAAGTPDGTHITTCESVDPGNVGDANASDWYMGDVAENYDVPAGATVNDASVPALTDGTLKMNDLASPQDSCKDANLFLVFATR